jgi:predicted DNA-binding transcriptional regulator AlpA
VIPRLLRYKDLKELGIVRNHTTLDRWIKAGHFPPGILIGPNTRAWTEESIAKWLAARERDAA